MEKAEVERRALALYERISERPGDEAYRRRLLAREDAAVVARVEALSRSASDAAQAMPTVMAGYLGQPIEPPEQVGPFRLVEPIGQGGMGQVWRGERHDGLYEQRVAIKLIHAHLAPLAASRFIEERRILARLEHPNIARLIDGGVTPDGVPYLVMEFVDGQPIDAKAADMALAAKIGLFIKAADAVQFSHERLIVHADLKPSNILVDAQSRVKLLDFGIARLLGEDEAQAGPTPMTEAYASAARLAGEPPGVADDVYSLGVVLEGLIEGASDADLAAIARKARAPDAAERYGSVAALIADLDRWREGYPVSAQPDSVRYRMARFVSRHLTGVAATAAALLVLSVATAVATANYFTAERARAEATARFDDLHGVARYLLFDLSDQLDRQPQSLALRAEVARISQTYLDRLASGRNSPELTLESVQGLMRLAERQARPGRPNLGQVKEAKANLAKAYALARTIPGAEGERFAASIRIDQSLLAAMVENDLKAGDVYLADADRLIADGGGGKAGLRARYYQQLAALRQWQGRYPESIAAARSGLLAAPPPDARQAVLNKAALFDILAESIYYGGDPPSAVGPYREQMALLEEASKRWPNDPLLVRQLPRSRWALGSTLLEVGGAKEALPLLETGVVESQAIADAELADVDAARALGIMIATRAQALSFLGRNAEAIEGLEDVVARRRALAARYPDEVMRKRDVAVSLSMLADVEAGAGRMASACARYGEVEGIFAALRKMGRATALDDDSTLKMVRESRAKRCS